jgi:hypothetical protein
MHSTHWQQGHCSIKNVLAVAQISKAKILTLCTVRRIARKKLDHPVPVYDLTVDGVHEYFANGFLVHNCDAVSGAFEQLQDSKPFFIGRAN